MYASHERKTGRQRKNNRSPRRSRARSSWSGRPRTHRRSSGEPIKLLTLQDVSSPKESARLYRNLGIIATGSHGTIVELAKDLSTYKKVVVKVIPMLYNSNGAVKHEQRLLTEIKIMKQCKGHPNVVQFENSFFRGTSFCVVMEYMDKGSLHSVHKASIKAKSNLFANEPHIAFICFSVLSTLIFLHARGIIHRDIKSDNIMTNSQGDIKLADFGQSARLSDPAKELHSVVGTLDWIAPEVFGGKGYSSKVDIWSFGITLKELVENKLPYKQSDNIRELILEKGVTPLEEPSNWTKHFHRFMKKCLSRDPLSRPEARSLLKEPFVWNRADQNAFRYRLNKLIPTAKPISVPRVSVSKSARRPGSRESTPEAPRRPKAFQLLPKKQLLSAPSEIPPIRRRAYSLSEASGILGTLAPIEDVEEE